MRGIVSLASALALVAQPLEVLIGVLQVEEHALPARSRDDRAGQVDHRPAQLRVRAQDRQQQRAVAAADVHDRTQGAPGVGARDDRRERP